MSDKQNTILELWPAINDDMQKFISDRPGWFIEALTEAKNKKRDSGLERCGNSN